MYNPLAAFIEKLAADVGVDDQIVKIAICLLSTFPLNAVMKRLPDNRPNLKCGYILFTSLFYLIGVLNNLSGFRSLLTSSLFTFFLTRYYSHSKLMPWLNFILVMLHLEYSHAVLSKTQSGSVITGAEMVLVMKITAFAWSYYDGQMLKKNSTSSKDQESTDLKKQNTKPYILTDYQKSKVVSKHPSLLKFMAYCFFYPSLLTGPAFDFADFDSWLDLSIFKDLPESFKPKNRYSSNKALQKREIPKNGRVALKKIAIAFVFLFLFFKSLSIVPMQKTLESSFVTEHGFWYRAFYLWWTGLAARFKYYAAWTIAEASCIVCGLGYNGFDTKSKKIKWNRVQNIDFVAFETAQNTHAALEAWNQNTNKWLKYYIYLRVSPPGGDKKPGFRATFLTFLTSALWHGTSAGYYLTFITGACFQTCGRFARRHFRPLFMKVDGKTPGPYKPLYDILTYFATQLAFGYMVQPFIVLNLKDGLKVWASVYYYIHIGVAVMMFAFMGPYKKKIIKFLNSKTPQKREESKKLEQLEKNKDSLSDILKDKVEYEKKHGKSDEDIKINLGIPDLDQYDIDEMSKDYAEFMKDYADWKDAKGLEIEESNIQKAFEKFKKEFSPSTKGPSRRRMSFSDFTPLGERND